MRTLQSFAAAAQFVYVYLIKNHYLCILEIDGDVSKPQNYIVQMFKRNLIDIPSHFNVFGLDNMRF